METSNVRLSFGTVRPCRLQWARPRRMFFIPPGKFVQQCANSVCTRINKDFDKVLIQSALGGGGRSSGTAGIIDCRRGDDFAGRLPGPRGCCDDEETGEFRGRAQVRAITQDKLVDVLLSARTICVYIYIYICKRVQPPTSLEIVLYVRKCVCVCVVKNGRKKRKTVECFSRNCIRTYMFTGRFVYRFISTIMSLGLALYVFQFSFGSPYLGSATASSLKPLLRPLRIAIGPRVSSNCA